MDTDKVRRGLAIQSRRQQHGIRSLRMFAEVVGVHRTTVTLAERGGGSEETLAKLERFLDKLDEERGINSRSGDVPPAPVGDSAGLLSDPGIVEVEVSGPSTEREWHVVFRAHADNLDLIAEAAEKLRRHMSEE